MFNRKKKFLRIKKSTIMKDNVYFLVFFNYEFLPTYMSNYNFRSKFTKIYGCKRQM